MTRTTQRSIFHSTLFFLCVTVFWAGIATSCGDAETQQEPTADASITPPSEVTVTTEPSPPEPTQPEPTSKEASPAEPAPADEFPDIPTVGDVGTPEQGGACGGAAVKEWPLHNKISIGEVKLVEQGPPMRITVDASAGGSQDARSNPFVYLNLKTGKKVSISDYQALDDKTWDLAFKRVVIRSNSGDSGSGEREVARLTDTSLEKVTQAPAQEQFKTDIYLDADCKLLTDPIGTPLTAFNILNPDNPTGSQSWYSYGGPGGIAPVTGHVYIVRRKQTSEAFKVQLLSWTSGTYTMLVQPL